MTTTYIPFAYESASPIELVEEEREDVIDQLDRRRAAIQELEAVRRNAGVDETELDVAQPIAVEANDTLAVLTKSILRNIKDVGVANENIAAIAINNDNVAALLNNYEKLYTSEEYTAFINKLIELTKVTLTGLNDQTLNNVPNVEKIVISPDTTDDFGEFSVNLDIKEKSYDVSAIEYVDLLPSLISKAVEVSKVAITGLSSLSGNTLEDWKTATIDSIDDAKVKAYTEYAIHINNSVSIVVANLFDKVKTTVEGFNKPELTEEVNSLEEIYKEICKVAEHNFTLDKATILENHMENLTAIEAFRDSALGKILLKVFDFIVGFIKGFIASLIASIINIIDILLAAIRKIPENIMAIGNGEKLTAIKSQMPLEVYIDLSEERKIGFIYNDVKYGYSIGGGALYCKLTELDEAGASKVISKGTKHRFSTLDELVEVIIETNRKQDIVGIIAKPDDLIRLIAASESVANTYRDNVMEYMKSGDTKKLVSGLFHESFVVLSDIVKVFGSELSRNMYYARVTAEKAITSNSATDVIEQCNKVSELCKFLNEEGKKEKSDPGNLVKFDNKNIRILEALSVSIRSFPKIISRKFDNLDKILNNIEETDENRERVAVAKAYTKAMSAILRLNVETSYSTVKAIRERFKTNAQSKLIAINIINKMYAYIKK